MSPENTKEKRGVDRTLRYSWLVLLLTPFLIGGVVTGDGALLLNLVYGLDRSHLSFAEYARSNEGWYIPHHVLWFVTFYVTTHAGALLHFSPLVTEAIISTQTIIAILTGIILCYRFLVRRMGMAPAYGSWVVLAFFTGGYGVYTFYMGGSVECYMVLLMSVRLFFSEQQLDERSAWKLAVVDVLLIALKAYSLFFLVAVWPLLLRSPKRPLTVYALSFGTLFFVLLCVKLWLWNPDYNSVVERISLADSLRHLWLGLFDPRTGLPFCLPVLFVLFWHERSQRRSLIFKLAGLCACAFFFSLYPFYDGDVVGGRYIFPFVVALLPEVAGAANKLLHRFPKIAWMLPLAVVGFLPVAALSFPFFPDGSLPTHGSCRTVHPVIRSWTMLTASITGRPTVNICMHERTYIVDPHDTVAPRSGVWRIAYLLEGGHTPAYLAAVARDPARIQRDVWGAHLIGQLKRMGLASSWLWIVVGLVPALLSLWLSLWAVLRINRVPALSRQ